MRIIPDQLRSKNLVPFRKRHGRYKIPGMTPEHEVLMDRVDPDLSPEEQSYIRHYLGYADALIRGAEENAFTEPGAAGSPESALPAEKPLNLQPSADPAASLVDESSSAKNDPVKAA
jgi:hypothetical protein